LIEQIGVFYIPEHKVDLIADESDNRFLELAVAAKADYLITSNSRDFNFSFFGETRIISPAQFIDLRP